MSGTLQPMTLDLAVVLVSIVCHTEELLANLDEPSRVFDVSALETLLDQPVLTDWVKSLDPVLLPVKRG